MSLQDTKAIKMTDDQFNAMLGAVISARDYTQDFLIVAAQNPTWFEPAAIGDAGCRLVHLESLLNTLYSTDLGGNKQ